MMNIRPAGYRDYSSDDDEASECESGFSENSEDANEPLPPLPPSVSLQKAIQRGALDEVEQLVAELPAADYKLLTLENGLKPLVYAASIGNTQLVDFFVKWDVEHDVSTEVYAAYTPLMAVCSSFAEKHSSADDVDEEDESHLECLRLLLAAGHDVGFRDRYGEMALMRACKTAPIAVIQMLVEHSSAQLNEADNDGWTPLFFATNRGHVQLVQYLLEQGADPAKVDKRNRYPYTIAMEKGYAELIDLLIPESERQAADGFVMPSAQTFAFDAEEDTQYCTEVLEMVAAVSNTVRHTLPLFAEKRLALRDFLLLRSEQQLKELGVVFSGHRRKILSRIKQFHVGCWLPQSFGLADMKGGYGRLIAVLTFMATLHRQLYVLRTSIEYLKEDLTKLSADETTTAAQLLAASKYELLQLNERLAVLRRQLAAVHVGSRPYLMALEIVD